MPTAVSMTPWIQNLHCIAVSSGARWEQREGALLLAIVVTFRSGIEVLTDMFYAAWNDKENVDYVTAWGGNCT